MDECVILFRNTGSGKIGFVSDDEGEIAVFADRDAAIHAADTTTVCRVFPWQVVEADEI